VIHPSPWTKDPIVDGKMLIMGHGILYLFFLSYFLNTRLHFGWHFDCPWHFWDVRICRNSLMWPSCFCHFLEWLKSFIGIPCGWRYCNLPKIFYQNYEKGKPPIQAAVRWCLWKVFLPPIIQSIINTILCFFYFPCSWIVGSWIFWGRSSVIVFLTLVFPLVEALKLYSGRIGPIRRQLATHGQ